MLLAGASLVASLTIHLARPDLVSFGLALQSVALLSFLGVYLLDARVARQHAASLRRLSGDDGNPPDRVETLEEAVAALAEGHSRALAQIMSALQKDEEQS